MRGNVCPETQLAKSGEPPCMAEGLNLTDEQRTRLRAIEEKASKEAKDLLTVEQQEKLRELANPESMMQCMGSKVSARCSEMHDKAEEAHSSH
jgi:Spy/CpxP family protein refolding chaperone